MPEYLPLGAFRQGLLPSDCRACAWWLTAGNTDGRGDAAFDKRHDWITGLEHHWGDAGILVLRSGDRRAGEGEPAVSASVHFAPAGSVARLRELPFPPLPSASALLFCFHAEEGVPRWAAKRLIRKAVYELRRRGVKEVYAIAHANKAKKEDCRFFSRELLTANGFEVVTLSGPVCLMRLDNRGLVALIDQAEATLRRLFAREHEPAPSPAAWAHGGGGAEPGP